MKPRTFPVPQKDKPLLPIFQIPLLFVFRASFREVSEVFEVPKVLLSFEISSLFKVPPPFTISFPSSDSYTGRAVG